LSAASPLFQNIFVQGSTELPAIFKLVASSSGEQSEKKKHKKSYEVCTVQETLQLPPFHGARYGGSASTVNGITYIIGGADIGGNATNNVLRFGKVLNIPLFIRKFRKRQVNSVI